jgi:hypothetical protein
MCKTIQFDLHKRVYNYNDYDYDHYCYTGQLDSFTHRRALLVLHDRDTECRVYCDNIYKLAPFFSQI